MTKKKSRAQDLTDEEIAQVRDEGRRERHKASSINESISAPVNAAVALNALSEDKTAFGGAERTADEDQETQEN